MVKTDVVGFYFMDQATGFQPPPDLVAFLEKGPPPRVYWVRELLCLKAFHAF